MNDWVDLSRRQAGLPPETELIDGVPDHLRGPLGWWVGRVRKVDLTYSYEIQASTGVNIYAQRGEDLLGAVDAFLYWIPRKLRPAQARTLPANWQALVAELDQLLTTGRSVWRVNARGDGLERRIEEAVTTATRETVAHAAPVTQDHLHAAWAAAYGRSPNPDLVLNEAIRAVEDVVCPLVLPKMTEAGKATLGTVIRELQSNLSHKWELVLPDKSGRNADITGLVGMMELLWHSQLSRHGGGPQSRRQHPAEAKAALHLAVTLVHLLSTGVLRSRVGT